MTANMDPYVYPKTTVLKNRRGIRDAERLHAFEAEATRRRLMELDERPSTGSFDAGHLQKIHRHIFQDVYPWAGTFRSINIARSGQFYFAFAERIESALRDTFRALKGEKYLGNLDPASFAARAAHYFGEINAVHPFREGNGRAQREFVRQLAHTNGHALDWRRVPPEQMHEASRLSFQHGDNSGLEGVLRCALPEQRNRSVEAGIAPVRRYQRDRDQGRER